MKKTYLFSIISLLLFNTCSGQSESNVSGKSAQIEKLISTYADYGKFNGTVLVAEEGKVVYKKAFGMANMEWDIPNAPDTKHRLGSITKQFTSALLEPTSNTTKSLRRPSNAHNYSNN